MEPVIRGARVVHGRRRVFLVGMTEVCVALCTSRRAPDGPVALDRLDDVQGPMDRVETANAVRAKQWTKEAKVGEGTYAVVYRGQSSTSLDGRRGVANLTELLNDSTPLF